MHDHPPPRMLCAYFFNARCNNRSRAIAHVRSNGQPEAATVGPREVSSRDTLSLSSSHLSSRIISVHCLAAYNQEDLAVLCVEREREREARVIVTRRFSSLESCRLMYYKKKYLIIRRGLFAYERFERIFQR